MSGSPELDDLGARLGAALERELPRLRRRRVFALGALAAVAAAVPAAGAATDWAGLAGGETPLPTQVADDLRVPLAASSDSGGGWRLEVYRAALNGSRGRVGICVFVTRQTGGTGRCVPNSSVGSLLSAGQDPLIGVAGGVVDGSVARVEITVRSGQPPRRRVVAVTPADAPAAALRARDLPDGLRPYTLATGPYQGDVLGVRALDAAGRTVATDGRPAPPSPTTRARPMAGVPVPPVDSKDTP